MVNDWVIFHFVHQHKLYCLTKYCSFHAMQNEPVHNQGQLEKKWYKTHVFKKVGENLLMGNSFLPQT